MFEAIKGVAVLAAGFGVLTLLNKDAVEIAEHWVRKLHMDPEGHLSMVFLRAAEKVTDANLWAAAAGALAYSTVRFVEAYGLWNARVWAEWFALLSGCLYLPWEIYEVIAHPTSLKYGLLADQSGGSALHALREDSGEPAGAGLKKRAGFQPGPSRVTA